MRRCGNMQALLVLAIHCTRRGGAGLMDAVNSPDARARDFAGSQHFVLHFEGSALEAQPAHSSRADIATWAEAGSKSA
jgi:hypothetical protein